MEHDGNTARRDAAMLLRRHRPLEARARVTAMLAQAPRDADLRLLLASCLLASNRPREALAIHAALLDEFPTMTAAWLGYGHASRVVGRYHEALAAYRRAIALSPRAAEAWWSIANLKTGALDLHDAAALRGLLADGSLADADRAQLLHALGRVLEEARDFAASAAAYRQGAALRRAGLRYDPAAITARVDATLRLMDAGFFARQRGGGDANPAPVFIVGLPRSGSTLIEQMLASHDAIEGTMELPELVNVARGLGPARLYPDVLATLSAERLRALGADYLRRASAYRTTARPYFTDKMPGNWMHLGLIQLILPHARIIDARRGGAATCCSILRQYFAEGHAYSYDARELARFRRDYLRAMAHFDAVLPGRVHRVRYEALVADPEPVLRGMLEYLELPFQERCLRFFDNPRAVGTSSSEQVRRPIYQQGALPLDPAKGNAFGNRT